MNITRLPNGNLEMTADVHDQAWIKDLFRNYDPMTMISMECVFISERLGGDPMGDGISYEQVAPEEVGALTGAPLISDGENIYGFMDYQVRNFLDELANGATITWQKG